MLEKIDDLPAGIDGCKAIGKVSKDDYDQVLRPLLDAARRDGRRLRFLYHFGPEFDGFTPSGAWEDAKIGLTSMRLFEGCAIVSDSDWILELTRFFAFLMPCPVHIFRNRKRNEAIEWLQSLPEGAHLSHQLLPEAGVIIVEMTEPLRAQDFDSLALSADTWLQTHHDLRGLVIHARQFLGWEDLGSVVRHMRFVRDHHRKIKRVALVTDSQMAKVAPVLANPIVQAEVKSFHYADLQEAVAWTSQAASAEGSA